MKKIKEKIYRARQGAPFPAAKAHEIGVYIETNNLYTPEKLLDAAREESSLLHSYLEWDDSAAAEAHRKTQCKNIINHIEVEIVYESGKPQTFDRGFINVTGKDGRIYIPITEGLADAEYREQIIAVAIESLRGWHERYESYKEFSTLNRVIVTFLKKTGENKDDIKRSTISRKRNPRKSKSLGGRPLRN